MIMPVDVAAQLQGTPVAPRQTLLYLVTEDWYFWSHRLPMARAARDAGYRVIVATRVRDHRERIEAEGFEVVPMPWKRSGDGPVGHFRALRKLVRLYRSLKPDLVHHVALKPVIFGSLASLIVQQPKQINALTGLGYIFIGSSWGARLMGYPMRVLLRLLVNRRGSRLIVQNDDDFTTMTEKIGIATRRVELIPGSGIDPAAFTPMPEPEGKIVVAAMVSRMLRDKGVGEFVEAARQLAARKIPVRMELVGPVDPDNPTTLHEFDLRRWEAEIGTLVWRGATDDVPEVWRNAHIAVLPSYREGLPKALLEAAACGRPLIATDVPGCREIARNGINALLVPPHNGRALADAIETLAGNPALRAKFGAAGRELVETVFAEARIVAATLALYRSLLQPVSGP